MLTNEDCGTGEMVQLVECLPRKHKEPSLVLRTHIKRFKYAHVVILVLERQRQIEPWLLISSLSAGLLASETPCLKKHST